MKSIPWIAGLAALMLGGPVAAGCLELSEPCKIASGDYHIKLPDGYNTQTPIVMFLHGYGGNGKAILKNKRITAPLLSRGYAVIAPNALMRTGGRATSWNFHPNFNRGRNESEFFQDVMLDVVKRFKIKTSKTILAGFSIGGSMTSYIACNNPDMFKAYTPVSGSFWRPHPTECVSPVNLFHTHGWTDSTVPLEGRRITKDFIQGDVFFALNIWRKTNQCDQPRANKFSKTGNFMRRKWTQCNSRSALEFALFPGGHTVPKGWSDMMLDWFEKLPATSDNG